MKDGYARLEGMEEVLERLNEEAAEIEGDTSEGLWEAGLQIQRSSQKRLQPSIVTGNLRASAYTRAASDFRRMETEDLDPEQNEPVPRTRLAKLSVEVGHTASYALYAHENVEGNRAPKFLENALRENERDIIEIIRRRAKV